ncbi:hypothetical protein KEM56_007158 [Ascosphaera pollenicola]|nr:hypothetical protein KEM56_007158 [Ascosphaera pollenicola]
MGNDGGSIPTRRELVKQAARNPTTSELKENLHQQLEYRWTTCALSRKELMPPIVSDSGGNLYNKDSILRALLPGDEVEGIGSKADCEEVLGGRVRSLRDIVEVKFELDQDGKKEATGSTTPQFVCPITRKALGPNTRSVYLIPCGHAFAEEAVRVTNSDRCLQCDEAYTPENVILILPTKESDKEQLISRITSLAEKGLTHSLKKSPDSKKRKKHGDPLEKAAKKEKESSSSSKKHKKYPHTEGIKNAATAMLTSKVLEEQEGVHKRRKANQSENLQSLFTSSTDKEKIRDADFLTRGYVFPSKTSR